MKLEGKVAIITGAGQGIGKAYAERFLNEGAKVVVAELNEDRAEIAMKELAPLGDVFLVKTDISNQESARACAAAAMERFGAIDVLLNNAGLYYDIDMENNALDYLERVFRVNLHGTWLMSGAVAPFMVEAGSGSIINVSSGAAYTYMSPPSPKFTELSAFTYSQTKWGVVGLTKFTASQLGQYNIRVNCIAPGITMTDATKKIVPEEFFGLLTMMSAMGKTLEPEDITGAAVFFASEDSKLITGQVLCVDAGMHMPA